MSYEDYSEAARKAQSFADATGFDYGIEKVWNGWRVFLLPRKENRAGIELRCEVRSCSDINRQREGHGGDRG